MAKNISFDIAHLTVLDTQHYKNDDVKDANAVKARATASFLNIYSQFQSLPKQSDGAYKLPKPTISLPREKMLPLEKPKTRWEQFKENKGIKTQKKETKVFDEETGEWRLRYGYKRAHDPKDTWVIEVPNGKFGPGEDPFIKAEQEKKEKITKQKKQERRNALRSERASIEAGVNISTKSKLTRATAQIAKTVASHPTSSASMNQFNKVDNKPAIFEEGSKVPKLFDRTKGQKKKNTRK